MNETFLLDEILTESVAHFEEQALKIFRYQSKNCQIYRQYIEAIGMCDVQVTKLSDIPFLPIGFFKSHEVKSGSFQPEAVFTSSGTTGQLTSKHYIKSLSDYQMVFTKIFELFYGKLSQYRILALLPSYLERQGSSLVYMADKMIQATKANGSGFHLYNFEELAVLLKSGEEIGTKTLLFGVTHALLDMAEKFRLKLTQTTVIETGGMKGRREELTREDVHERLRYSFGVKNIHSEYGMTELMSQAYSSGNGVYSCPPWMRIMVRPTTDPLANRDNGRGCLNIIDLGNIHSCCFIATQDVGRVLPDGRFEVMGRMEQSEVRGCNLLVP